ncbi:MAG: hypothetical protein ACE5DM_05870 [Candidatus Nanoarchaeia archaeon]
MGLEDEEERRRKKLWPANGNIDYGPGHFPTTPLAYGAQRSLDDLGEEGQSYDGLDGMMPGIYINVMQTPDGGYLASMHLVYGPGDDISKAIGEYISNGGLADLANALTGGAAINAPGSSAEN